MAWTYDTLKQAIRDYLEVDTEETLESNLDVIIQQCEDRILKSVQLPDFRKNATGSLTQDDPYLGVPTDYLAPYSLSLDNSGIEFLLFKDVNFIREAYPSSSGTGTPKYYALFEADFFIVGPTPDINYAVEPPYFYKPESIVTAGTTWLGDNAVTTLLYGCLIEAYIFLKGDADLMGTYEARFQEGLMKLKELGEYRSVDDSYRR